MSRGAHLTRRATGRRRPPPRRSGVVARPGAWRVVPALSLLAASLAGCSGSLSLDGPAVPGAEAGPCAELIEALPDEVADQQRREVDGTGYAAAWGDPAIELRCGVPRPPGLTRFAACQEVDGVGWFVPESQRAGDTVTITTIGRIPRVSVRIPPAHSPPATTMVDLGPAVERALRQVRPCV